MKRPRLTGSWQRAAGELLLIIVGVLCALWIQEWRQSQIDRQTELDYLSRLVIDLQDDITRLEGLIDHTNRRESTAISALDYLSSERIQGDAELIRAVNSAGFIAFFRHNRATLDELLSTGNLNLVRDKALLRDVTNYYRSSDFLLEFDHIKRQAIWVNYRDALNRHLSSLLIARINDPEPDDSEVDWSAINWSAMKADPDLRIGLEQVVGIARVERRMASRVLEQAQALQARLKSVTAGQSGD